MTDYRRNCIPGGSYFFTVALAERSERLLTDNIDLLRRAVSDLKREHPFELVAMVVLPESVDTLRAISLLNYIHLGIIKRWSSG